MGHRLINPGALAKPVGFSHGVMPAEGRLVFLAGQTAADAEGKVAAADMTAQFEKALQNLQTVLQEAGGTLTDIVTLTIYVTSVLRYRENLKPIGKVYQHYFGRYYPAMTLVGVAELFDPNALIEIEGVAVISPPNA